MARCKKLDRINFWKTFMRYYSSAIITYSPWTAFILFKVRTTGQLGVEGISGSLVQTPVQSRMLALPQNAMLYPDCLVGKHYPHPTCLMSHHDHAFVPWLLSIWLKPLFLHILWMFFLGLITILCDLSTVIKEKLFCCHNLRSKEYLEGMKKFY